jgi:hypothetical protein
LDPDVFATITFDSFVTLLAIGGVLLIRHERRREWRSGRRRLGRTSGSQGAGRPRSGE